jgi:chromosome segregation ATPase
MAAQAEGRNVSEWMRGIVGAELERRRQAADASAAHGDRDEEIARLRGAQAAAEADLAALREKLASYDSAISWATSCTGCATLLDACTEERERAEQAEAKLAAIETLCGRVLADCAAAFIEPSLAHVNPGRILAIITGEEAGDGR